MTEPEGSHVATQDRPARRVLSVSVVIPVYRGATTLPALVEELSQLHTPQSSPDGRRFSVDEVLLVWDHGVDDSDRVIREISAKHDWVRPIWLSRNFGQHAATLAGMTSAGGQWIVTMDEDGQHDPAFIGAMLDTAYRNRSQLVYAASSTPPPHGFVRNAGSRVTKSFFVRVLAPGVPRTFNSYRMILGEAARSVAAYTGPDVFLDVALSWVVSDSVVCPVKMREEGRAATSYSYRRLASHFWRLVISSGTRPLRAVSIAGLVFALVGLVVSIYSVIARIAGEVPVQGWTSVFVTVLVVGGAILFSLGLIAEYLAAATNMSLGKPVYVIVQDPSSVFDDEDQPAC